MRSGGDVRYADKRSYLRNFRRSVDHDDITAASRSTQYHYNDTTVTGWGAATNGRESLRWGRGEQDGRSDKAGESADWRPHEPWDPHLILTFTYCRTHDDDDDDTGDYALMAVYDPSLGKYQLNVIAGQVKPIRTTKKKKKSAPAAAAVAVAEPPRLELELPPRTACLATALMFSHQKRINIHEQHQHAQQSQELVRRYGRSLHGSPCHCLWSSPSSPSRRHPGHRGGRRRRRRTKL